MIDTAACVTNRYERPTRRPMASGIALTDLPGAEAAAGDSYEVQVSHSGANPALMFGVVSLC